MPEFIQERKLPIMATVSGVIGGLFSKFGSLLAIGWFVLLLLLGLGVAIPYWGIVSVLAGALGIDAVNMEVIVQLVSAFLQLVLLGVISVAWYRKLLLAEDTNSIVYFRLGKRELVYFVYLVTYGIVFSLLVGGLVGSGWLIFQAMGAGWQVNLFGFASTILVLFLVFRTMLVLAGVAVDQPQALRSAWKISQGNCWRIFWSIVLLYIVLILVYAAVLGIALVSGIGPTIVAEIFLSIESGNASLETILFVQVISIVLTALSTMVGVIFLSNVYRHLSDVTSVDLTAVFGDAEPVSESGA